MIATSAPYSQYFDKNGDPLDSGYVYFGVPDANPETSPIPAFWDEAGTQPVAQPARTLAGYIVRNGTPARVYVEGAYSQTVKNKRGELVYYAANSEDYSNLPVNVATIEATAGQTNVNLPFSYTRGNNSLSVYLNGSLLLKDRDYIETSETAIQMLNPLKIGPGGADEVTAIGGRLINPSSAVGTVSAAALAAGSGAGLVGYDASLTFPADTVGERLQYDTWADSYYDAANGASAWRLAFEAAIAELSANGGTVKFKAPSVTFDDVLTVDVVGITIEGQGTAAIGAPAQGASTIIGDHNNGPVIRFRQHSSKLQNLAIGASTARKAGAVNGGSATTPCVGVLYEGADTSGGRADNMEIDNVRVYDQPFHGVLWSGSAANNIIRRLVTDHNEGHGWVIDRGTMTGRTNTGSPGIFVFENPRSYDNGGHAWAAGNPNDTVLPTYRVTIWQGETYRNGSRGVVGGTPTLTTNRQLYTNHQAYVRGDNNFIQQSAFGGDGPSSGGAAVTGGLYLAGRTSEVTNCRYIDCLAAAGCVYLGQVAATPSFYLKVDGLEVRTPDAAMNPAVRFDAGIIGLTVINENPSNITALVDTAALSGVTHYYIDDYASGILTDQNFSADDVQVKGIINFGPAASQQIVSGAITVTETKTVVDVEGGVASTDDLNTINGGANDDLIILRITNSARQVVVRHGVGNILLAGKTDKALQSVNETLTLYRVAGNFVEIAASKNGTQANIDLGEVGARVDGTTDDSAVFNAAVLAASVIVRAGTANNDIVTARVILPPGVIRIASAVTLKTGVQIVGAGSGATCILVDYAGNGLVTTSGQYSNVRLQGFTMEKAGSAVDAISVVGLIRNCVFNDVVVKGFRRSFNIDDTWTLLLENCASYSVTGSHVYCGAGCGEILVNGGRYDVATGPGIYMNSTVGELTVTGAAVQFGSKSAVEVDSARSVRLVGNFFEGNCIGSATDYYADLVGNNDSLSSCTVEDNVFNDLSDPTRYGLGIIYANQFNAFVYRERWARNGTTVVPVLGSAVQSIDIGINNAAALTSALTPMAFASDNFAVVRQQARPQQFYGIDMNGTGVPAPQTRSSATFSNTGSTGVALGTYDSVGAVQSYGGSLKLNPWSNTGIEFCSAGATMAAGTNEFYGRYRIFSLLTSSNAVPLSTIGFVAVNCTAGNRLVTLTNILATGGRRLEVVKNDATANTLTITPASGTINGAATFVLTAAYQSVRLTGDGTNWIAS